MKKRNKSVLAWAGFSSGELCSSELLDGYSVPGRTLEIFTTRKTARCRYQDVRRVRIMIVR